MCSHTIQEMAKSTAHGLLSYMNLIPLSLHLLLLLNCLQMYEFSQSPVRNLPGFDGPLPFELETGYISIDDSDDGHFFYYFFKSENKPTEDPLLFWFDGGPGCSGVYSIFYEFGPLSFQTALYNGSTPGLILNPYSWTKLSNIVLADAPVGTGFSYSRTYQGSYSSDTLLHSQVYVFMRKWLINHPQFLSNPLYVGGSSYSGITVPMIVQDIADGIDAGDKPVMNFKGYLLGNPLTDPHVEVNSRVPFTHGMGIISYQLFESAKKNCGGEYVYVDPSNEPCKKDVQAISKLTEKLYEYNILEANCPWVSATVNDGVRGRISLEKFNPVDLWNECSRQYDHLLCYYWANDETVQTALNIRKGFVSEWVCCNQSGINYGKNVERSTDYHLNLSKRSYRSLIYSGDHDLAVPFLGTDEWIRSLNYSIKDDWRPWLVDRQVAGYTLTYTNDMTFATVKGGGHTAPEFKPKECFAMFKRWLSDEPL